MRAFLSSVMLLVVVVGLVFAMKGCHPPPPPPPAQPPSYPNTAHVVVDMSLSMKGYFNGNTEFKNNVAQLAAALEKARAGKRELQAIQYELVGELGALEPTPLDTQAFIEQMRSDHLIQHHDSLLQKAFENISASLPPADVAMLISDSIISYPDAEIRAHPRINIDNIASLGSEVETVFAQARMRGQEVMVLASLSGFHGTYYDYQNRPSAQCCPGKRPYYIWLLGHHDQLQTVADLLRTDQVQAEHEISFNHPVFTMGTAVLQTFARVGTFYRNPADPRVLEIKSARGGAPIQFAVALDLTRLPPYMQDDDFLRHHLHSAATAAAVVLIDVKQRSQVQGDKNNDAPALLPAYTHVVTFSLSPVVSQGERVEISIDSGLPSWYLAWSNEDDAKTSTASEPTTFGLRYLVEGISRAYSNTDPAAKTTISVRK